MNPADEDSRRFDTLCRLIAYLRGPDGCPWDRSQTHASLKPHLLEESYEVLEALDAADAVRLKEELGDLLVQIVFHAQLAAEAGQFSIADVVEAINAKLVRRHPHVFGEAEAKTAAEVWQRWDAIKREERGGASSALDGAPRAMSALAYAQALLERAARAGFRWPGVENVLEKLAEELRELAAADSPEQKEEEFGDILINLVNVAFMSGIDAESALRRAAAKFRRRFQVVEGLAREQGADLSQLPLPELERLWQVAKGRPGSG